MLEEAEKVSKKMKATGVILAGDYNARHPAWGDTTHNQYGNKLFDKLDSSRFTIHTSDGPTFKTEKGSSVIDLIISSSRLSYKVKHIRTDEVVELYSGAPLRGHLPLLSNLVIQNMRRDTPVRIQEKLDVDSINWNDWSKEIEEAIQSREEITQTVLKTYLDLELY